MSALVLWLMLTVNLYGLGVRMVLHPDIPLPGSHLGAMPPPARMKRLGFVVIGAGVVATAFLPFVVQGVHGT